MPKTNVIKKDTFHYKWSKSHKPVLSVRPGSRVHFEVNEVSSWQVTEKSRPQDLTKIDDNKLYPLAGPVYVEGAQPGDALAIEVEEVKPASWGWTGIMPGLGLLSDEFNAPYLHVWDLSRGRSFSNFRKGIKVPLAPFCGVMGVAPPEDGYFDVLPPGRHGGNMDIRHLTAGSKLVLPVYASGALFSVCDVHAAQGDGEVCVTAIECPGDVTLSFDLIKNSKFTSPCYYTSRTGKKTSKSAGSFVTTGIAPDLMSATKQAVRNMISHLEVERGLTRPEGYMLCSVAADLKIHEVVDAPNWVVGLSLPMEIFGGRR
ncbi:MAG TPA: acetamidase/formamidase family protein [Nitrososphaerales archaeon]|nr:acetamidase/formamidase family protein [Nitrososphaerales archaeon]